MIVVRGKDLFYDEDEEIKYKDFLCFFFVNNQSGYENVFKE